MNFISHIYFLASWSENFIADPCYHYKNLSDANRKKSYSAPYGSELCDSPFSEGWYRLVGAAGTKMPTTRVPAKKMWYRLVRLVVDCSSYSERW